MHSSANGAGCYTIHKENIIIWRYLERNRSYLFCTGAPRKSLKHKILPAMRVRKNARFFAERPENPAAYNQLIWKYQQNSIMIFIFCADLRNSQKTVIIITKISKAFALFAYRLHKRGAQAREKPPDLVGHFTAAARPEPRAEVVAGAEGYVGIARRAFD